MNLPLINDALDMLRLQFKPLQQYQYPRRHTTCALLLLGMTAAAGAAPGMGEPLNVVLFFTAYIALETSMYAAFMRWWLRRAGVADVPSLFGTVIAASAIQLLGPLTSWLPDDIANILSMAIGLAGLWLLVSALAAGSAVSRLRILLGTLAFAPAALLLFVLLMNTATNIGLISVPPDLEQAMEQARQDAGASAPAQGSSSGAAAKP